MITFLPKESIWIVLNQSAFDISLPPDTPILFESLMTLCVPN